MIIIRLLKMLAGGGGIAFSRAKKVKAVPDYLRRMPGEKPAYNQVTPPGRRCIRVFYNTKKHRN